MFNEYQKLAAKHYCGGEMSHVQDDEDVRNCGDGLFRFIMVELSDTEDCDTDDTAKMRMEQASEDLLTMSNTFEEEL